MRAVLLVGGHAGVKQRRNGARGGESRNACDKEAARATRKWLAVRGVVSMGET